jgi:hypothetical protein
MMRNAIADDATGRRLAEGSVYILPRLSVETYPLTVKMGSVVYHIPRNYFVYPNTDRGVFLRVTFPDFLPFTEGTRECLEVEYNSKQPGCTQIMVNLTRGGLSNLQIFKNVQKLFRNPLPRTGPFNYEVFDVGPDSARIEYYRREDGTGMIFFHCFISIIREKRTGFCDDFVALEKSNSVRLRFDLSEIEHVPEVEAGIRKLMNGFRANGEKP